MAERDPGPQRACPREAPGRFAVAVPRSGGATAWRVAAMLAFATGACGDLPPEGGTPSLHPPGAAAELEPDSTFPAGLAGEVGWRPGTAETLPEAKVLAAAIAQDLSGGRVVYAQLVGAGESAAAITVLVEVERSSGGAADVETRVLDLRLERTEERWQLASLRSEGGVAIPPPPDLPVVARAVLDHPSIRLPDTARWDIHRGEIDLELLELLLRIAERHEIHVMTLLGGRPRHVFGTDRLSRHATGQAADIYKVEGIAVVDQRKEGTPAHGLVSWLFELGIPELGSPWALDGFGGRSFTDLVHQDHIHVAVGR